jgi:hypothetical protein
VNTEAKDSEDLRADLLMLLNLISIVLSWGPLLTAFIELAITSQLG